MTSLCCLALAALLALQVSSHNARAQSVLCDDPELCLPKRFLRFGRSGSESSDGYYLTPHLAFSSGRRFVRLGRAYEPYQDKRFLRFGRAGAGGQRSEESLLREALMQAEEPLYRKRRSAQQDEAEEEAEESAAEGAQQRVKRRSPAEEMEKSEGEVKSLQKRDINGGGAASDAEEEDIISRQLLGQAGESGDVIDGFRKRFMRFGRAPGGEDEHEEAEKRFMRFGKRFMRFGRQAGKRFMRFGRGWESAKRFMRFGRPSNAGMEGMEGEKRFMRFGKRDTKAVESRPGADAQ